MRWEGSEHRRSTGKRKQGLRLPIPSRIIIGSLAIAAIVLAFVLRPPEEVLDTPRAAPEAKPTVVSAAIVAIPTAAPPASAAAAAAATTAPASGPTGAPGSRIHEVVQGDTLSTIARKYYGDASKFGKILDANRDVLKNADSLQLGMKLRIPE